MILNLLKLYGLFFKMGLFTFGGGYAMLPILQSEIVNKRKWITKEELLNYYSIGQCTPGIIAVNSASFIGYKRQGISGLISATLGVVSPSLIIIIFVATLLNTYMNNSYLQHAFAGIRLSVIALIISTVCDMWKNAIKDVRCYLIFFVTTALLLLFDLSAVMVIILAALSTIVPNFQREKK